jgi:tRNA-specific 2-thiouridylase
MRRIALRDRQLDRRPARSPGSRTRPPRSVREGALDAPAAGSWLSQSASGTEIELADGEDGVSPGQGCVFYDGAQGQARVQGGGFIRAAAATARAA